MIDITYRFIEARSKLEFLRHCKNYDVILAHLNYIDNKKLNLHHYRSIRRYDRNMQILKRKLLIIEIFEL